MKRRLRWFGLLVLQAVLAGCGGEEGAPDGAGTGSDAPGEAVFSPDEATELWFVEFETPPSVRLGSSQAALDQERIVFKDAASRLALRYKQRFSFDRLWNGLSVQIRAGDRDRLAGMPGVKAVYPVVNVTLDGGSSGGNGSQTDLFTAISMTGADIVHSQLGYMGTKVLVGVIDSGIDFDHPDLGGCFGPGCRVAYGYDFVGDDYDAVSNPSPVPDAIPDDCGGHGSHVAGIIGANGTVVGVAPNVTYGAYRVFGCSGSTSADIMIQAMDQAYADGMRVVNMSIGSPFQWPSYPTATAANTLVSKGVVVVTSTGNSGASGGLYSAGAPGVGDDVIASASIENTDIAGPAFSVAPGNTLYGYTRAAGAPIAPLSGSTPMLRTGTVMSTADACTALPTGSLIGAIALVRRGGCTFYAKASNAYGAGAVGVVLYNNVAGTLYPTVAGTPAITIPVVAITMDSGAAINALMDQSAVTHTWTDQAVSVPNALGGLISDFSSFGLTSSLSFKPDIAAPGGSIYSTVPLELGAYDSYSGTSMASPHVAGTVALLLEARPAITPLEVRQLLQNTAEPALWAGDPTGGVLESTFHNGAGLVQIDKAILTTTMISPSKIAVGESDAGPWSGTLTLTNMGASDVTYDVSHVGGKSAGGSHWAPVGADDFASVQLSATSVTVPAGETATVDVTITANQALADGSLYGGYVVFTETGGSGVLHVPYAGFKGDYQSLQVMTAADGGYPRLASRSGSTYTPLPNGGTFTLAGTSSMPWIQIHYDHSASEMKIEAFGAATMKPYGLVTSDTDIGQNSANSGSNAFDAYGWNGMVTLYKRTSLVPNGDYILRVSVRKALGDPANPAHWETYETPVITINHP